MRTRPRRRSPALVLSGVLVLLTAGCGVGEIGAGAPGAAPQPPGQPPQQPPGQPPAQPPAPDACPCPTAGANFCAHPMSFPDCPMVAPGGYCDPDGDRAFDDGDWLRGYDEYRARCGAAPAIQPPSCDAGTADCDGLRGNGCETTLAGSSCGAAFKALALIDQRLYAALSGLLDAYLARAQARRGFQIALQVVEGIDDWSYAEVKEQIRALRRERYPALEGVLLIGNIKLPSFYKSRNDITLVRPLPRYFEDLDGVFEKRTADGATDPKCGPATEPDCAAEGPVAVPRHDLDYVAKGPQPDPELWAAFMPVGRSAQDTHRDFAEQLVPYLRKVVGFYRQGIAHNGRFYFVSNDDGEDFPTLWSTWSPAQIDFFGKPGPNGETGAACLKGGNNVCYQRWPLESFSSAEAFMTEHAKLWVGEGWQQESVFMAHMNAQTYAVVEVNVHSEYYGSLVRTADARRIQRGGLIVALSGCGVGGFRQPGSPSHVDPPAYIEDNVMAAYLYGSSQALAVLGDPFWRGHFDHYPTIWREMKHGGRYLGAAHRARMQKLFAISGDDPYALRENGMELLMGDPFMDLR